ncbi:MAG TPA: sulfatase-like hydrolase/transferase [Terriglobales bacterium]|nr:sulfatase-like hydrolase/transferase [Terriglobales bacterium]
METINPQPGQSKAMVWFYVLTRLVFTSLLLLTSIYCLLAYLPDMYYAFIQAPFQPWLRWLIRFHPYVHAALLSLLGISLVLEKRRGEPGRVAWMFLVAQGAFAIYFFVAHPFSRIGNNSLSYIWSLVLLIPALLLGFVDSLAGWKQASWESWHPPAGWKFGWLLMVSAAIGVAYPGLGFLRCWQLGKSFPFSSPALQAWLAAVTAHVLLAAVVLSLFNLAENAATRFSNAVKVRFLFNNLITAFLLDRVLQNVILASLPFDSLTSQIYSAVLAMTLVMLGSSLRLRLKQARTMAATSQEDSARHRLGAVLALVLMAAAYIVPALIGVVDWNFLLEKLWALLLWASAFGLVIAFCRVRAKNLYPVRALIAVVFLAPLTYHFLFTLPTTMSTSSAPIREMEDAMARHSYFDVSFQVVRSTLTLHEKKACDDLCQFLSTQTNLPPTANVPSVDVELVKSLTPAAGRKPNIFVFVIDSLRPDYLSPYNPDVRFTPEIGKFAAESAVMLNAFTRYAGTTLSEPAIWAGAMLLHKHYIQPFHPVNGLEKLLDADGYQRFVSVDTVLQVLLRPTPDLVRLDENVRTWTQEDFCSTARDAEAKISRLHDRQRPLFLFAQPQNVHGITLGRLGADRQPKKSYPRRFHPILASEIERLDGCFGEFTHYLQSAGLYDNSIIVLTSDHGDAFGEFGHKGHALDLHPSVLRVPLIIHLPPAMRKQYVSNPDRIAFNIDITPTLYYLLGHRPIINDERFGVPLFTATAAEAAAYQRSNYLVVSSYGAVYGLLGDNGRKLFIANVVEGTNDYFDLVKDPGAVVNRANDQLVATDEELTRTYVQQIANLYHFKYHSPTFADWLVH